jgi:hypothetical protein
VGQGQNQAPPQKPLERQRRGAFVIDEHEALRVYVARPKTVGLTAGR